jgi:NAD(P)-dependent dehydrogenase (short-subunit alcohol dehydrogenase family)
MSSARTVLLTGSSSGFGFLASTTLARRGHRVFASMRDPAARNADAASSLERCAREENLELRVIELDVRDESSARAAVEAVLREAGRLDVLVNNAGAGCHGILEAVSIEQARDLFETNVFAVLRMNRAVLEHMRSRRSGLLIHISSGLARFILPFYGAYAASKAAVEVIAETARYELAWAGIDSVIVEPGPYGTRFFESAEANRPSDQIRASEYGELYRLGLELASRRPPLGDPVEVAQAIAELVDMPAGTRPLRTTVGGAAGRAARLNDAAAELQRTVLEQTGLRDVVTLTPAESVTQEAPR